MGQGRVRLNVGGRVFETIGRSGPSRQGARLRRAVQYIGELPGPVQRVRTSPGRGPTSIGTPASLEDKHVLHAIAMEDGRSFCVINEPGRRPRLRRSLEQCRRCAVAITQSKLTSRKKAHGEETCYPKLAAHGGQLFASTDDTISVFSGPDHVLTSTLRGSDAGANCDFTIRSGDRLFSLHHEENVFDVWDTLPPPVI
ncbi:hypothetical protein GUJ93_ZPchr0002g24505 [Zizania palustris]|uniref:At2g24240-like C-terminal beta-propeller domain-containing protein n=1 Tax=Zizania palustris TaxID=103762 RepID=A0A8J5VUF1_ZIZPA|nr:hypothetical protein GUJ93_ZPchr0002g24505 [Zizania palustris]